MAPIERRCFCRILEDEHEAISLRRTRVAGERGCMDRCGPPVPLVPASDQARSPPAAVSNPRQPCQCPKSSEDVPQPRIRGFDTTGLALSGGGIRSASVCLGVLQALASKKALDSIDYLSTVSGGGYIGCSTVAAMSSELGFPFQSDDSAEDVRDSPAMGHLRNFSSYLLPRNQGAFRNGVEVSLIFLRGLLANALFVGLAMAFVALLMLAAYGRSSYVGDKALWEGGLILKLAERALGTPFPALDRPFSLTVLLVALTALVLLGWVLARSFGWGRGNDVKSCYLSIARVGASVSVVLLIADLLPLLSLGFAKAQRWLDGNTPALSITISGLLGMVSAVVLFSSRIAQFLKASDAAGAFSTLLKRVLARGALLLAAAALPALLILVMLLAIDGARTLVLMPGELLTALGAVTVTFLLLVAVIKPNAYSLHQLYRDRLSNAFLFHPVDNSKDPRVLDQTKLSCIDTLKTPYPIINVALNLQGSEAANMRGRHAEFFVFTPLFAGADITHYIPTKDMERIDSRLDLGTAMAISGAAVSSNMGSASIKSLAPTLALLNFRLGYWLPNPRALRGMQIDRAVQRQKFGRILDNLFLVREIFSKIDEKASSIYLTDGGHIENLGVYQLLKRGCRFIIAVDAEADPTYSFGSLLTLARYARIDLGVRIDLPWDAIAATSRTLDAAYAAVPLQSPPGSSGPHAAIGTISYPDRSKGTLLYVKASLTGDERDYVLDYKRRYPQFPHETTGDQFFSEEQFEAYRWLGFHMMSRVLEGRDKIAIKLDDAAGAACLEAGLRQHLWTMP